MKALWLMGLSVAVSAFGCALAQAQSAPVAADARPLVPVVAGPVCEVSGKWKGTLKTPVITSADGHERMYGWLEWDRPQRWTKRHCEANWWIFASVDGEKFKPIVARNDFLREGQQASLAVAGFSSDARWAGADVMTTANGVTTHGYVNANLAEHTSCFGSAAKGLDGVRQELLLGDAPWLQQLKGIRDDGWLQLSVHAGPTVAGTETHADSSGPGPVFEPCSGKVKVEAAQ